MLLQHVFNQNQRIQFRYWRNHFSYILFCDFHKVTVLLFARQREPTVFRHPRIHLHHINQQSKQSNISKETYFNLWKGDASGWVLDEHFLDEFFKFFGGGWCFGKFDGLVADFVVQCQDVFVVEGYVAVDEGEEGYSHWPDVCGLKCWKCIIPKRKK